MWRAWRCSTCLALLALCGSWAHFQQVRREPRVTPYGRIVGGLADTHCDAPTVVDRLPSDEETLSRASLDAQGDLDLDGDEEARAIALLGPGRTLALGPRPLPRSILSTLDRELDSEGESSGALPNSRHVSLEEHQRGSGDSLEEADPAELDSSMGVDDDEEDMHFLFSALEIEAGSSTPSEEEMEATEQTEQPAQQAALRRDSSQLWSSFLKTATLLPIQMEALRNSLRPAAADEQASALPPVTASSLGLISEVIEDWSPQCSLNLATAHRDSDAEDANAPIAKRIECFFSMPEQPQLRGSPSWTAQVLQAMKTASSYTFFHESRQLREIDALIRAISLDDMEAFRSNPLLTKVAPVGPYGTNLVLILGRFVNSLQLPEPLRILLNSELAKGCYGEGAAVHIWDMVLQAGDYEMLLDVAAHSRRRGLHEALLSAVGNLDFERFRVLVRLVDTAQAAVWPEVLLAVGRQPAFRWGFTKILCDAGHASLFPEPDAVLEDVHADGLPYEEAVFERLPAFLEHPGLHASPTLLRLLQLCVMLDARLHGGCPDRALSILRMPRSQFEEHSRRLWQHADNFDAAMHFLHTHGYVHFFTPDMEGRFKFLFTAAHLPRRYASPARRAALTPCRPHTLATLLGEPQGPAAAFRSAGLLAAFRPDAPFVLPVAVLAAADPGVFAGLQPEALQHLLLDPAEAGAARRFFATPQAAELLRALPTGGAASPCEHLGRLFDVMDGAALAAVPAACLVLAEPAAFAGLSAEQAAGLDLQALLFDQAARIPPEAFAGLTAARARRFGAGTPFSACAGLTGAQLGRLPSKAVFDALGPACLGLVARAELHAPAAVPWLPTEYFEGLSAASPHIPALLANASPSQMRVLSAVYLDEAESPFSGLRMDWARLGGAGHAEAVASLSLQALELMDPATLRSMPAGEFGLLGAEVRRGISAAAFAAVPAAAVAPGDLRRLVVVNTGLCAVLGEAHLADASVAEGLPPACLRQLPAATWAAATGRGTPLPPSWLAQATAEQLATLPARNSLTAQHWAQLTSTATPHPCAALPHAAVARSRAFWHGVTMDCFAALSFLEELDARSLQLARPELLAAAPDAVYRRLSAKAVARDGGVAMDCAALTPRLLVAAGGLRCSGPLGPGLLAALDGSHAALLPDLSGMTADQVAALSPALLDGLSPAQLATLPPAAAAGLRLVALSDRTVGALPPACLASVQPSTFALLKSIAALPDAFLEQAISRDQVRALPPAALSAFPRFDRLGSAVDPLSRDHPCLGVTDAQRAAMDGPTGRAFLTHCRPVFDSHRLEAERQDH